LFVCRLSYDTTEEDLEREFRRYGPIERIRLVRGKDAEKHRGYAFIVFEREGDMRCKYSFSNVKLTVQLLTKEVTISRSEIARFWLFLNVVGRTGNGYLGD
jgi:U1 small nuclear ribonucleoprotein 70kDa